MKLKTENIEGKTICIVQNNKDNGRELLFIYDNKPLFQYDNTSYEVIKFDIFSYSQYRRLIFKLLYLHFAIISTDIIDLIKGSGKYQKIDGYYIMFDYLD